MRSKLWYNARMEEYANLSSDLTKLAKSLTPTENFEISFKE